MGLLEIGISVAAALLVGALARRTWRTTLLLLLSVLAVYWFQPAIPLRSLDFWLPSLTLAFVILTWLVTSTAGAWKARQNLNSLLLIVGAATFVELSRYFFSGPILTATKPPPFLQYLFLALLLAVVILLLYQLSRRQQSQTITFVIVLLIAILVILKTPVLSQQTSLLLRMLANRSVEGALPTDLRWLGFSYIAFRLIHVLRDRQTGRLPELSLAEFATYVVFFPSLAAGPIDRAERFAGDLRKDFRLTQDDTLTAGRRLVIGLFKKFVIADALALIALNDALAIQIRSTFWMWVVTYAYAFQIYYDFSGYTDIALGTARLAGVRLPENFASPYLKPNLAQFWNSWHITLTQWIRSYFFNPFNRWLRGYKSMPQWMMILIGQLSTMLLIGLWHGVTVNFVLWGLWHGIGLFLQNRWSDFARRHFHVTDSRQQTALNLGGIFLTFNFVALGWVFFALTGPALSWMVLRKLLGI
jgi:D-alanyl-lipoteichoic acid acyltransferase DltB (MBOAT superfamily)